MTSNRRRGTTAIITSSVRAKCSLTSFVVSAKYCYVTTKRRSRAGQDAYELVFGALAHPVRRRILHTLNFEGGVMTAGDIAAMFAHAWPTTTRHLQVLEAAGLLRHEKQGRTRVYRIDRKRLALVRDWLEWFFKNPG